MNSAVYEFVHNQHRPNFFFFLHIRATFTMRRLPSQPLQQVAVCVLLLKYPPGLWSDVYLMHHQPLMEAPVVGCLLNEALEDVDGGGGSLRCSDENKSVVKIVNEAEFGDLH